MGCLRRKSAILGEPMTPLLCLGPIYNQYGIKCIFQLFLPKHHSPVLLKHPMMCSPFCEADLRTVARRLLKGGGGTLQIGHIFCVSLAQGFGIGRLGVSLFVCYLDTSFSHPKHPKHFFFGILPKSFSSRPEVIRTRPSSKSPVLRCTVRP